MKIKIKPGLSLLLAIVMVLMSMPFGMSGANAASWLWPVTNGSLGCQLNCTCPTHNGVHNGIDIIGPQVPAGTPVPVLAAALGTVTCSNNYQPDVATCPTCHMNGGGYHVEINHGNNLYSNYCHLSGTTVSIGQTVTQGQVIGYVGNTGYSFGDHLHFSMAIVVPGGHLLYGSSTLLNPLDYVSPNGSPTISVINEAVSGISDTDARISATLTPMSYVTTCGFYIGTSANSLTKISETVNGNVQSMYYNLASDWHSLNSGTTYYYKFFANVNGVEYQSTVASFTTTASDFTYMVINGEAQITGYTGTGGAVLVPGILGGVPVTSIGDWAFYSKQGITSIILPSGVTSIGENAFCDCKSLTSITIPSTVSSIGMSAFDNCISLTTLSIPVGVMNISEFAFSRCIALTNITIPSSVTSIGNLAFLQCSALTTITITSGVISIGDQAFQGCSALTSITIPSSVASIGYWVFNFCDSLTSITFNSATTFIPDDPDTIPAEATILGYDPSTAKDYATNHDRTFQIKTDQDGDFIYKIIAGQAQITSYTGAGGDVTIPDELGGLPVTSISDNAFPRNSGLTSVHIPPGVASMGEHAFGYNAGLISITVAAGNSSYTSIDGVLYNKEETTLIRCPYGMTSIDIPQTLTSISAGAFSGCKGLTSLSIPQGVTNIGVHVFAGCTGLTSVIIPEGVTVLTAQVFSGCTSLTSVSLPSTLTSIGNGTFQGCSTLTAINIPQTVTSIGYEAFISCAGLTTISLPAGLTSIGDNAFNATGLISVGLPQNVTNIGMGAFMNCLDLTGSIYIPQGVTGVGYGAFMNCANLSSISFSSPTTTIGDDEYTIPAQATIIGYDPSTAKDYADNYGRTFQIIGSGSNDATLSDLSVDGTTIPGFDPATTIYNEVLQAGTTVVPTVTASVNDIVGATAEVTPAASLPGTTTILVTAADGVTTLTYTINFTVVQPVAVTPASPNVNVDNAPLQITVPADVNNASLKTSPVDGVVFLPQISVQSSTSMGDVTVYIINETEVIGPTDWDGTINLPQVVDSGSVTVTPENGYEASVSRAIELGITDSGLTFSQPVQILLAGQGGKKAGWILNETFSPITYMMPSDTAEALEANPDGYLTVGSDLVIWTTHFTTFVAYTETPLTGYTLSGQVLVEGDDLTEDQLHYSGGATIELKQGEEIKYSTTTSAAEDLTANGSFSITGIAAGDYIVVISKAGYLTRSFALTINSDLTLATTSAIYHNRIYLWAGDIVSDEFHVIAAADVNYILSKFNSDSTQVGFDPQVDIVKDQYNVISAMDVNLMLSNFNKNSTEYPGDIIY